MITVQEQHIFWDKAEKEVKRFSSKEKYVSDYENKGTWSEGVNKLYSRKKIKLVVYSMMQTKKPYWEFINSLQKALVIKREDKTHNILCEYAVGDNCTCWCGEKYHGLHGRGLSQQIMTKEMLS